MSSPSSSLTTHTSNMINLSSPSLDLSSTPNVNTSKDPQVFTSAAESLAQLPEVSSSSSSSSTSSSSSSSTSSSLSRPSLRFNSDPSMAQQDKYKASPLRQVMSTSMLEEEVMDSGDDEVVEDEEEDEVHGEVDEEEEDVVSATQKLTQKEGSIDLQVLQQASWRSELHRERFIRSGWLEKKSQHRKNWNRRWFVLRASRFTYYKDESEYSALAILPLPEIHSVCPTQIKSRQHILAVVTRKRIYYLDAMLESELNQWIQAFHSLLESNNNPAFPSSISPSSFKPESPLVGLDPMDSNVLISKERIHRSGYLWRLEKGKLGKHWKKRWAVLKADRFMCYKDEQEYAPLKVIYLDSLLDTLTILSPKSLEKHLPSPSPPPAPSTTTSTTMNTNNTHANTTTTSMPMAVSHASTKSFHPSPSTSIPIPTSALPPSFSSSTPTVPSTSSASTSSSSSKTTTTTTITTITPSIPLSFSPAILPIGLENTTCFQMVTTGKSFFFASDTREDMCYWVLAIRKLSNASTTATPSIYFPSPTTPPENQLSLNPVPNGHPMDRFNSQLKNS